MVCILCSLLSSSCLCQYLEPPIAASTLRYISSSFAHVGSKVVQWEIQIGLRASIN